MEKICTKCKISKPLEEFYNSKKTKDGKRQQCKACTNHGNQSRESGYREKRKAYRQKNKEKIRQKKLREYAIKKEHILAVNKEYRKTPHFRYLIYKKGALNRGLDFPLSEEEFISYWNKPCFYCGSSIEFIGIDRKDSSIGYYPDNLVPCCTMCNRMKMNYSYEDFIKKVAEISSHLKLT